MFTSPFDTSQNLGIDPDADIIFVADFFIEDYAGGAEMTTEALIQSATDLKVQKLHSNHVAINHLKAGMDKHWIFGNIAGLKPDLIATIIGNLSYSILEYDYKFCQYRSIEKHEHETGSPCDCSEQLHGKMISAFFHGSKSIWWMSEEQEKRYLDRFPFLADNARCVLSSVFGESFFSMVGALAEVARRDNPERKGWIVLGSDSWIKGAEDAIAHCEKNNLEYEVVWGIPHDQLLAKLAVSEGFVYLPRGGDTCPRMVIEARAVGCNVVLNDHVQHKNEEWFAGDELEMMSYLYAARERFWTAIKSVASYVPTLSGYTTVRNAIEMKYPWMATVQSMLGFCHEVVVVDGGSSDGTWEKLQNWAEEEERLMIKQVSIDEASPSFAYESDGMLKATARDLCTSEYCWQMDADEIVHEHDYAKVHQLLRGFPRYTNLVSLPVIEYWGSTAKVRLDINPWKWRVSRNLPHITQGIPTALRNVDDEGYVYASMGTDSCDYIDRESGELIPHAGFYDESVHNIRLAALGGNEEARKTYETWFNNVVESLPGVHHYSWYNISNKISQYKLHWGKFWKSMYRHDAEDTTENNVMFDKPWAEVSDTDITTMATKLSTELGGWIFHNKVDFSQKVPHISVHRGHPSTFIAYEKSLQKLNEE